jgi:hypothetical protein
MSTPEPITSDQLKALRNARSVTFHYDKNTHLATVRATREHDPGDGFGPRDISIEFPVQGLVSTLLNPLAIKGAKVTDAFWALSYASVEDTWRTALHHLRPGDELAVRWEVGGQVFDRLKDAGFTTVSFTLEVTRTSTKGRKYMVFLIAYAVERLDATSPSVRYGVSEYTLNAD